MATKKNSVEMRELVIDTHNPAQADELFTEVEKLISNKQADSSIERVDEANVYRSSELRGRIVAPLQLCTALTKLISKARGMLKSSNPYHRTPFGYVCKDLEARGWEFRGKLIAEGLSGVDEYRVYVRGGRTRLLHHPTFKLYQLTVVDTSEIKGN